MEYNQKEMTQAESVALIASMINKAKNRFSENGVLYLWWGWIVFACSAIQFIAIYFFNENAWYVWLSTWIMAIFQIFIIKKKRKTQEVRTYTEELDGFVWMVFFICMMLSLFIVNYSGHHILTYPILLVLYGMPIFLSGVILKFKPLIFGSICCWILSVIALFTLPVFQLLLIASAIVLGWIIPGYLLKKKFKDNVD